ncbi:MAG TPA: hypothetical protein VJN72_10540 [Gaiellales bacterium]|nr:hypothetical protein [Gaiellales bacterium]
MHELRSTPHRGGQLLRKLWLGVRGSAALVAALVMRASERRPSRRAFLKSWAIAAGAWMCAGWAFAILFFALAASTMSQMP